MRVPGTRGERRLCVCAAAYTHDFSYRGGGLEPGALNSGSRLPV